MMPQWRGTLGNDVQAAMLRTQRRRKLEPALRAILAAPDVYGHVLGIWARAVLGGQLDGDYPMLERIARRAA